MKSLLSTKQSDNSTGSRIKADHKAALLSAPSQATWLTRLSKRAIFKSLKCLDTGRLEVTDGREKHTFGPAANSPDTCSLTVTHPAFYPRTAFGGTLGCAESYMDGEWHCNNLTALIQFFLKNMDATNRMESGLAKLTAPLQRYGHWLRGNTVRGSRNNIVAHYDLSNDFFALLLDETMMYSSAFFEKQDSTLLEASTAKNERLCTKLKLNPNDHLLEIGTGWGGFAIHAAKRFGCRVTTTTISKAQFSYASERVAKENLSHKITVLQKDYRELDGQYDKLVSIEMIEAVGHEFLNCYFKRCSELLKPHGAMALQAITIQDRYFDQHTRSVDFIKKHIFPGSCLPSVARMLQSTQRNTDLSLSHLEDITPHYARTLRLWRERFNERIELVSGMGFGERFIRMWEFYLCYCEAGFSERYIGAMQLLFAKPGWPMTAH